MYPRSPYRRPLLAPTDVLRIAREDLSIARQRRSIREFATTPVPRELIAIALENACTAPSGANRQPWRFVAVSDPAIKHRVRLAAEEEEREFYAHRATPEWLEALAPIGTDPNKPFLDDAPWLIVVFRLNYETERPNDLEANDPECATSCGAARMLKNYYVMESVGIAVGMLIAALNRMGLACLTHTPAPMSFLNEILDRPRNEKPYVMLPVGYPADGCSVPDLLRKPLEEMVRWIR